MEGIGFISGIIAALIICGIFNKKPMRYLTTILALFFINLWFNHNGNYLCTYEQIEMSPLYTYIECAADLFVFSFPPIRGLFGFGNFVNKAHDNTKQSMKFVGKLIHIFFR